MITNQNKPTKIGVVGNRFGWNYKFVERMLTNLGVEKHDTIISGGADGVDTFAQLFAKKNGLTAVIHYPDWETHGKKAAFVRNELIAKDCEVLVAFDLGSSSGSGTLNTINHAKRLNKRVVLYDQTHLRK